MSHLGCLRRQLATSRFASMRQVRWSSTTRIATFPSLEGKTIAITGAGGGIGLEAAKRLAANGARLSLSDIQEKSLFQAAEEIEKAGGQVHAQVVDVTREESVDDWIEKTVARLGKLDGAVNLHGVLPKNTFSESARVETQDTASWNLSMAVNLTGLMFCMRAQLRQMNDNGSVVNAASVGGVRGYPNCASYVASKWGVVGLTKAAATEVGPTRKIRVNCIAPATVRTPMIQQFGVAQGAEDEAPVMEQLIQRDANPQEVAALCLYLLSDEASFITGSTYLIDGGHNH